eukprot:gnl/TRDRNA2_/TRDRNA2_129165_c0_seq2.p1 gnl/TRDRNA2_/TRDRNA2_129165_c0~~gnl/TRDRNA2_/TRDRNA2_129165_c0_seq2.p1  ORF type:complete len:254 (+),score=32.59 gnl/TRDRNA2_/TRDRNA2_129165_c0_seq2:53-814(+)
MTDGVQPWRSSSGEMPPPRLDSKELASAWGCCPSASGHMVVRVEVAEDPNPRCPRESAVPSSRARGVALVWDGKHLDDNAEMETTADTATSSSAAASGSSKVSPDFNGRWLCARVVGDMDTFLMDMGLGEALRRVAQDSKYGEGVQVQNVTQSGDLFLIENILKASTSSCFRVGAGDQRSTDMEGRPIQLIPSWDGQILHMTSKKFSGDVIVYSQRYLDGDEMVLELKSSRGTTVRRIFKRTGESPSPSRSLG